MGYQITCEKRHKKDTVFSFCLIEILKKYVGCSVMSIYGILLKNARTYLPLLLLTATYFTMAGIYPARRFLLEYAFVFKGVFLTLCLLAAGRCLNAVHRTSKVFNGLIIWFGLAMTASVFTSHYPVRAGSECDILLASFAFSYLFWTYNGVSTKNKMRLLGIGMLLFLHFSVCLCLACNQVREGFVYPWKLLFRDYFFNLDSVFRFLFISHKHVRCPLDYSNYMGYLGGLVLPFFIALICAERRKRLKTLWFLGFFYAFAVIFFSKSRMAWGLSALIVIGWLLCGLKRLQLARIWKISIATVFCIGCCTAAWKTERIQSRFKYILKGDFKGFVSARSYLAQDGWKLIQQKPLFGHGITTIPMHYLEARPEAVFHLWQLHVAPLQFLFEFGWFGGIPFGCLLLIIVLKAVKQLRSRSLAREQKVYLFGYLMSILLYLLFNSEDSWECFALSGWIALMLGALVCLGTAPGEARISRKTPLLTGIIVTVPAVCIGCSACDLKGRWFFQKFVQQACAGDINCETALQRAIEADPHNIYYYNHGGYWNVCCGFPKSEPHMRRALEYCEHSLKINPNQPDILENCGALYATLGDIPKAVDYYLKAILCLPYHTFAWVQLLEMLRRYGTEELYDEWLATATFAMPRAVFSQPQLLRDLQNRPSIQKRCIEIFDQQEARYSSTLTEEPKWQLEKYLRCRLFFNEERNLPKLDPKFLPVFEQLKADNRWDVFLEKAKEAPRMTGRYLVYLKEDSSERIRCHGGAAPDMKIATFCSISEPRLCDIYWTQTEKVLKRLEKQNALAFFTANGIASYVPKYAKDVLKPLIEKTRRTFDQSPE